MKHIIAEKPAFANYLFCKTAKYDTINENSQIGAA